MKNSGLFSHVKTGEEERDTYAAHFLSERIQKYKYINTHI